MNRTEAELADAVRGLTPEEIAGALEIATLGMGLEVRYRIHAALLRRRLAKEVAAENDALYAAFADPAKDAEAAAALNAYTRAYMGTPPEITLNDIARGKEPDGQP